MISLLESLLWSRRFGAVALELSLWSRHLKVSKFIAYVINASSFQGDLVTLEPSSSLKLNYWYHRVGFSNINLVVISLWSFRIDCTVGAYFCWVLAFVRSSEFLC
ncbi:hypothetical protein F8M41_004856 [Gigaspora margarita]|uniref:Uncharacterized protein n=1 Tax=Gigaspora margarita TaxID=4874 RepID=A0A8H4ERU4_GIGMA|nr:hypothetical protein F8M41_004856 [Gigaspora margarita]